jgi:hypothetical protein
MKHLSKITILCILLLSAWFMKTMRWEGQEGDSWEEQFSSGDAQGYYAYLPQVFISHSFSGQDPESPFVNKTNHGVVNKYFIGTPLCWSPFFGIAWLYAQTQDVKVDGYTEPFKKMISVAGLFWLMMGLFALSELLRMLNFSGGIRSITLVLVVLGTNLFSFTVLDPTMSHVYSFSTGAIFLCFGLKYFRSPRPAYLLVTLFAFGLGLLIRPTNIVWMVSSLPFLAGGLRPLLKTLSRIWVIVAVVLTLTSIVFLQCLMYYMQTGYWFLRTYQGEGFYFFQPKLWSVLFEFQKGWFIYTPLAALAMLGFVPLFRKDRNSFFTLLLPLTLGTYLISCWWNYVYADSFGHRAFVDMYALMAILLAYALNDLPRVLSKQIGLKGERMIRGALLMLAFLFLTLNQIQTYQYYRHILHYASMDWDRYKYIFLKTDDAYVNCLGGNLDIAPYSAKELKLVYSSDNDFSHAQPGWDSLPPSRMNTLHGLSYNGYEFGAKLTAPNIPELLKAEKIYAKIWLTRFEPFGNSSSNVLFVTTIDNPKHVVAHYGVYLMNDEPHPLGPNLHTYLYTIELPGISNNDSHLSMYVWNKQFQSFYVSHMKVELYRVYVTKE